MGIRPGGYFSDARRGAIYVMKDEMSAAQAPPKDRTHLNLFSLVTPNVPDVRLVRPVFPHRTVALGL